MSDAAIPPSDPLEALNQAFREAYAARRDEVLAGMGPIIAQIEDRLVLRRGSARLEGPARTRIFHELKAVTHIPLALHVLLSGRSGALDAGARARLGSIRALTAAVADDLDHRGFTPDQHTRQRRILDASLALLDEILAVAPVAPAAPAAPVAPDALRGFVRALSDDILRNIEDATRDQIETMHATVEAWKQEMTEDERARLRAVVSVSHMSRPGNVAVQYFSLALGDTWEGRFHQEELHAGKRVLASEVTVDEDAAFTLLATHELDAGVASRFFGEESRMERDLLADAAERILTAMFHRAPGSPEGGKEEGGRSEPRTETP